MGTQVPDDAFLAFAQEKEKEAASRSSGGAPRSRDFEQIQWTGLENNRMKIIRAVGGPPDSKLDDTTAKTVRIARIIGDNGKQFRCVFPDRGEDESHILWRIMARVNAVEWINDKKVFTIENKHPEIFNIVSKNGLKKDDKRFRFEKGWQGRHVVIMNVIDREQMEWHKENKHTMLLSRNISVSNDGREFPEEGIPSYGFLGPLSILFKFYKSWQKYDIGILKTGQMQSPYHIINAGVNIVEVPEDLQDLVRKEALTEEEAGWERYDLEKLFGYTSYNKMYNRLKGTIAKIDATLGTQFLNEIKDAAEAEQAQWDRDNNKPQEADDDEGVVDNGGGEGITAAPAARRPVRTEKASTGFNTDLLKGWDKLTADEKEAIENVVVKNGKVENIVYKDKDAVVYACPECSAPAPDSYTTCPNCGISF